MTPCLRNAVPCLVCFLLLPSSCAESTHTRTRYLEIHILYDTSVYKLSDRPFELRTLRVHNDCFKITLTFSYSGDATFNICCVTIFKLRILVNDLWCHQWIFICSVFKIAKIYSTTFSSEYIWLLKINSSRI